MMNKLKRESDSWASIAGDILCLVAEKIEFIEDYVSFCAVCRGWYVLGAEFYNRKKKYDFKSPFYMCGVDPNPRLPDICKVFPINPNPSPNLTFRSYASKRSFVVEWAEAAGRRCWGSTFGWLVTFGAADLRFSLVNPFTRATIPLPSMNTLFPGFKYDPPWTFLKAFLTADPVESPQDCLVIVVVTGPRQADLSDEFRIAYARPGQDNASWSRIAHASGGYFTSLNASGNNVTCGLNDVVSFGGKLYGVTTSCFDTVTLFSIQIQPSPRVVELLSVRMVPGDPSQGIAGWDLDVDFTLPEGVGGFCSTRKYLFELDGELFLVLRHIKRHINTSSTGYFKIFKVDLSAGRLTREWPLGGRCLFLGNHSTFTHETASPPPDELRQLEHPPDGFMSNHVFYTYDDDWTLYVVMNGPFRPDVGVWDMLGSDKVYSSTETLTRYPPLWMIPSIRFTRLTKE